MSMADEARMHNEAGCEWPKCKCRVPDYAFSMHNRVNFCLKLKEYDEKNGIVMKYREV